MIEMVDVRAGYGKNEILHGVNLMAPKGEITTVIGSNGSGKSTLLRALLGFLPIWGGDVAIDGVSTGKMKEAEIARKIAYLPQGKNIPDISVGRLVLHGRFPYLSYPRKYKEKDFLIAEEAMKQMGIWELSEKQLSELSGGMRQKVYIAMALAQQAPAIVMDEPTTYLDIGQQLMFAEMIRELSGSGKTIILVLHDILLALKVSHRIVAMQDGKTIACKAPEDMIASDIFRKLYGITVKPFQTERGRQYYYETDEKWVPPFL